MRKRSVSLTSSVINVELALANVMRATNARQVHQVPQVVPAPMANQVKQAKQENQAKITIQAVIVELAVQIQTRIHRVKDHPVHPVPPVPLATKALQVQLEILEKAAEQVRPAHQDPLVQLEAMANQDRKAHLATMRPAEEARKDPKARQAQLVNPDPKDPTAIRPLVVVDPVNLDQLVHPAPEVRMEIPANKVPKVHPAIPAQTLNIVLAHHEAVWSIVVALSLFFAISTKKKSSTIFPWKR